MKEIQIMKHEIVIIMFYSQWKKEKKSMTIHLLWKVKMMRKHFEVWREKIFQIHWAIFIWKGNGEPRGIWLLEINVKSVSYQGVGGRMRGSEFPKVP